jgi:hypothetical protein
MKTRYLLAFALILLALVPIAWQFPPQVPTSLEIEHLQINIWPEYDRPSVLVMYQIRLNQETPLPALVAIHFPPEMEKPYSVAMRDQDGILYNLDYSITKDQGQLRLEFKTPTPEVQIEFYDSRLIKNGNKRSYNYQWTTDYTIHSLTINVQQPSDSQNMIIVPNMGNGRKEQDGLTYYTLLTGEEPAGSPVNIQFSYEKSDDSLSAIQQPVEPVQPINDQTQGRATDTSALPWALAALGGIMIFGGILWFWGSGKRYIAPDSRNEKLAKMPVNEPASFNEKTAKIYCRICGKDSRMGDIYCHNCGARLKTD